MRSASCLYLNPNALSLCQELPVKMCCHRDTPSGRLSLPNWSLEYALGSGGLDLSLRDRSRAAYEEPDDIDEQSGDGQHAEQQHLREGNPKKRIQRIASRSHESDSQA